MPAATTATAPTSVGGCGTRTATAARPRRSAKEGRRRSRGVRRRRWRARTRRATLALRPEAAGEAASAACADNPETASAGKPFLLGNRFCRETASVASAAYWATLRRGHIVRVGKSSAVPLRELLLLRLRPLDPQCDAGAPQLCEKCCAAAGVAGAARIMAHNESPSGGCYGWPDSKQATQDVCMASPCVRPTRLCSCFAPPPTTTLYMDTNTA
eukprot:357754-Chlamydomonas_euryale.AAC.4